MKKVVITGIIGLFACTQSFANNHPEINKIVEDAIQFEQGALPIEQNQSEFVKMSVKINEDHKLEVLDANFSNSSIGSAVLDRIEGKEVDDDLLTEDTLYYHITFRKI